MPTPIQLAQQIEQLIRETAAKHNLSTVSIKRHNRRKGVVWARFEIMWRARHELGAPYALIGQVLGGRDHSTIMHGIERYENR
jgi:chromosomal replication initiator protein